ncbi:MAG: hypothetical protein R3B09_33190 [Nannocystaceae bacterium]
MRRAPLGLALALGLACAPSGVEIPPELREGAVPLSADRIASLQGPTPGHEAEVVVSDADGHVLARHRIDVDALYHLGSAAPGWPVIFAGRARGSEYDLSVVALDDATGEWRWWGRHPAVVLPDLASDPAGATLRVDHLGVDEGGACGARSILLDPTSGDPAPSTPAAEARAGARALHFGGGECPALEVTCSGEGFMARAVEFQGSFDGAIRGLRCGGAGERRRVYAWTDDAHAVFLAGDPWGWRFHHRGDATVLRAPTRPPSWAIELVDGDLRAAPLFGGRQGWRASARPEGQVSKDRFEALVVVGDVTYAVGDGLLAAVDGESGELLGAAAIPGSWALLGVAGGALWLRADGPRPWIVVDARTLAARRDGDASPLDLEIRDEDPPPDSLWRDPQPSAPRVAPADPTPPLDWQAALTPAVRRRLGLGRAGDPEVTIDLVAWEHDASGWAFEAPKDITRMVILAHFGEPVRETLLAEIGQNAGPWGVDREVRLPGAASRAAIVEFSNQVFVEPRVYGWPYSTAYRHRIGFHYDPIGPDGQPRVPSLEDHMAKIQRGERVGDP